MRRVQFALFLIVLAALASAPSCGYLPPLLLPAIGPEPGTYDLSEFSQFKYELPFADVGELASASVANQGQGRYVLEMHIVEACSTPSGLYARRTCITRDLGPRDLTSAEIDQMKTTFKNVEGVRKAPLEDYCMDGYGRLYFWDGLELSTWEYHCGMRVTYLADDSTLQAWLNDVRATFQ